MSVIVPEDLLKRAGHSPAPRLAYQALQQRVDRAMAMPGPNRDKPLSQRALIGIIREEIRDRQDSNGFYGSTQNGYRLNAEIIALLTRLLPRR